MNFAQDALKLAQGTEEEKATRATAMDAGLRRAIYVPLSLARHADAMWQWLIPLAKVGNINCKSDLQVHNSVQFHYRLSLPT